MVGMIVMSEMMQFEQRMKPPSITPETIEKAKQKLLQFQKDKPGNVSARAELVLSDGHEFHSDSTPKGKGKEETPQVSVQFGRDRSLKKLADRRAFCAEARVMQKAFDYYQKLFSDERDFPKGFNECWEFQERGEAPCDYRDRGTGGCALGFATFSTLF